MLPGTNVKPTQPCSAVHWAQHPAGSAEVPACMLCPSLFCPGKRVQGPGGGGGPEGLPLVTAGSGVAGSTVDFR